MTVPEESRPKTGKTEEVHGGRHADRGAAAERAEQANEGRGNVGRELEDAMTEAGVERDDLTGEEGQERREHR